MQRTVLAPIVAFAALTALAASRPPAPTNVRIALFAAPNGNAANDGTATSSPLPLSSALAQAGPSTCITLLPGIYPSIEITRPGTKLVSQTKWGARVVGSPGVHGIWADTNVGNVIIDGIEVANSSIDGIALYGTNSMVRNCWVHDSSGNGVSAHLNSSALIERNLIERNGKAPAGGHGIGLSGTNCIVRGNVIRHNLGWGCQIYEAPPSSSAECGFYDNLVYGNTAGLAIWSPAGQTNYVFNNTIISPTNYCLSSDYGNLCATNNILVVGGGLPVIAVADGAVVWSDYNLLNASASPGGSHDVVTSNPGFVNASAGLYWLTAVSPARGVANPAVVPLVDFFGRLESSVTDVGAVQYDSALAADTRVLDPSAGNGADYWAQVSGGGAAPVITGQPQNQTVIAAQSATFTVAATGAAPLSYLWTFNGFNVGSNSSSYTRGNCQLDDAGGRVQVTVSNGSGSAQSSPATLTVNAAGTNYFVAANGSSGNTGLSTNSAWPLTYAVANLGPGITLTLMPGVYPGPLVIFNVNGSAQNPMTIRSQVKWKAVIANSPNHGISLGFTPFVNYLVLDGLCVSNSAADGIGLSAQYCTVRNCWVTGNRLQGINASHGAASNNVVEYNLIENNGTISAGDPSNTLYHGIYFGGQNNIIRGNVVRNNNCGYGIHLYTGYAGVWNNQNYIYNNLTYGHTNAWGVTVWSAADGGLLPGTNYLFNNTILDGVALSYGTHCITNNIALASPQSPTLPFNASGSRVPIVYADYNLSVVTLVPAGLHDVVANAVGFANAANGLYWLTVSSPARGAANPNVVLPVDFFGNPQSTVADIGAFPYNATLAGDTRVLDPSPANPDYWSLP